MKTAAILGGGCMGLGVARELAKAGWQVRVYEKNQRFGAEATAAAAGMIGPQSEALQDDAYFSASLHSRDRWPAYAKALQEESGVDLGFRDQGALHLAFGAAYEKRLEAKYLWQKKKAGKLERLDEAALRARFPFLHPRASSGFLAWGDYWIDNEKLAEALELSCRKLGVELVSGVEVLAGAIPKADAVVLAAGAWAGQIFPGLAHIHPVKGQMLSFRVPGELLPSLPIHAEFVYLVPRGKDRLLCGATVETVGFDKRLTGEGIEWLLQNAFETMPDLRNCEIDRLWAGLRPGAADGWPSLGPSKIPGLHLCVGHYRRGILFLPLSVQAVAQGILQGSLPAEALAFSAERSAAGAARGL
jgi:glycine oxidase